MATTRCGEAKRRRTTNSLSTHRGRLRLRKSGGCKRGATGGVNVAQVARHYCQSTCRCRPQASGSISSAANPPRSESNHFRSRPRRRQLHLPGRRQRVSGTSSRCVYILSYCSRSVFLLLLLLLLQQSYSLLSSSPPRPTAKPRAFSPIPTPPPPIVRIPSPSHTAFAREKSPARDHASLTTHHPHTLTPTAHHV